MRTKQQVLEIVRLLEEAYPLADCTLDYKKDYELLFSVRLAAQCTEEIRPKSSVKGLQCSLSGLENQCNALLAAGKAPEYVCKYCLLCVADTVVRMTKAAQKEYPGLPVVCAGGVMSSDIIRVWVQQRLPQVYFVPGRYSSDNAIGVSILAAREAGLWLK